MPHGDPDETDPMSLQGVMFETEDANVHRQMAECFIEEYFRSGFTFEQIFALFQSDLYAGPRLAYHILGEETIRSIIEEYTRRRFPKPAGTEPRRRPSGDLALPILES